MPCLPVVRLLALTSVIAACVGASLAPPARAQAPARAADAAGFDCLIEPSQVLDIRSPVTGVIERVHAERGGFVRKGQPLVTLESTVERAAAELSRFRSTMEGPIQQAEARLAHSQRKLERKTDLVADRYVAVQERDDAEAERAVAQADLATARENRRLAELESAYAIAQLGQRVLRSPIDGVVVEQNLHPGELADAGEGRTAILRVAQLHPLRVKVILPFAHYRKLRPGMAVEIVPESPLEGRHRASVSSIDRVVDAASGTFQARIDLPNPTGSLPGGTKCRAVFPGL